MATITKSQEIAELIDLLPENEQNLAYELVKRMVLAWDSDFTKLTPGELAQLKEAELDFVNGDTVSHDDIDWE